MPEAKLDPPQFSLWFVPPEDSPTHEKLTKIVTDLAKRFDAPIFVPHVTLLPDINSAEADVVRETELLANAIGNIAGVFSINLGIVDYTDQLYQTLVLRAEMSESLRDANKLARVIFGRPNDAMYVPHLSLLYKKDLLPEDKELLAEEIGSQLKKQPPHQFSVDSIHIYTSVDKIEDWRLVKKVPFTYGDLHF